MRLEDCAEINLFFLLLAGLGQLFGHAAPFVLRSVLKIMWHRGLSVMPCYIAGMR
jgi:hypothetical protein